MTLKLNCAWIVQYSLPAKFVDFVLKSVFQIGKPFLNVVIQCFPHILERIFWIAYMVSRISDELVVGEVDIVWPYHNSIFNICPQSSIFVK